MRRTTLVLALLAGCSHGSPSREGARTVDASSPADASGRAAPTADAHVASTTADASTASAITAGGCGEGVTIKPPCEFASLAKNPSPQDPPGQMSFYVDFVDAAGNHVQPYFLRARPEDQAALEKFYRSLGKLTCGGFRYQAPCPDNWQGLTGFPAPPVGDVTR